MNQINKSYNYPIKLINYLFNTNHNNLRLMNLKPNSYSKYYKNKILH